MRDDDGYLVNTQIILHSLRSHNKREQKNDGLIIPDLQIC